MTYNFLKITLILLSVFSVTSFAYAGDLEHLTVQKTINAYGGEKFENLKSLTLKSDLRYGSTGQGYTPDYVDLDPMLKIHEFDLINGYGSEEAWGAAGGYAERVFTNDKGQFTIDYNNKTYVQDSDADLYSHFGAEIRTSDTLLAFDLMKHRDTAKHKGQRYFRGAVHELLEFDMPGTSIDPVLWVNSETGFISKMHRNIPDYDMVNYVFNDFKKTKGIAYAEVFELYLGSTLVEYAKSRQIIPNRIRRNTFSLDKGISDEPETFDTTDISVDHVSGQLHHVGQGYGFSTFLDEGEHIVGVGGYGGLGDRFSAYQEAQGHSKPLKYLILTHHHTDHLEGVNDALMLGAQLVAPETARKNLNNLTQQELSSAQLIILSEQKTSLGSVDVHRISTGHVEDFALVNFTGAKAIYDADHYSAKFKSQASYVSPFAMSFKTEVDRLGLNVEYLLTSHSPKTEKWSDFLDMANQYVSGKCPTGRKICAHLR